MNLTDNIYECYEGEREDGLTLFFMSLGINKVIKVVSYDFVEVRGEHTIYNLGFGDFDIEQQLIIDNVDTNNGDGRKVFNTVLSSVPEFFEKYPKAMIIVQGSDSTPAFKDRCRVRCRKGCVEGQCRKLNQRINIYRNYVDLHFKELDIHYQFFGGYLNDDGQIFEEDYIVGRNYISVLVIKR